MSFYDENARLTFVSLKKGHPKDSLKILSPRQISPADLSPNLDLTITVIHPGDSDTNK